MKIDLKKGDYVETTFFVGGKEYHKRGRVVYATSVFVVVRNPKNAHIPEANQHYIRDNTIFHRINKGERVRVY